MKKKIIVLLFCMLLISSTTSVVSLAFETRKALNEQEQKGINDVEWWPMFHHDVELTGFSPGAAPDTNYELWTANLGQDVRFSSPAVVDDLLYIGSGEIFGLRSGGWNLPISIEDNWLDYHGRMFDSSDDGNRAVQIFNGSISCLNAKTGAAVWSNPTKEQVYACPVVTDDYVYVVSADSENYTGDLFCLDAATGSIQWNKSVMTGFTTPLVHEGVLYLLTITPDDYEGQLLCLDVSDGSEIWNHTTGYIDFSLYTAPSFSDGKVYFTSIDIKSGIYCKVTCLNAATGEMLWATKMGSMDFGYACSSPVLSNGRVYAISANTEGSNFWCELFCINALNGSVFWNYTMRQGLDELAFASPTVAYGNVYFASIGDGWAYGKISCLDADDGTLLWDTVSFTAYTLSSPSIAENKVYIGGFNLSTGQGSLLCYDAFDGTSVWDGDIALTFLDSTPVIADDCAYAASSQGKLCAFTDLLEITEVKGGLLGVKAEVANVWTDDLVDVECSITVQGGILDFINISSTQTIPTLEAHTSDIIRAIPIVGFGRITITASAATEGVSPFVKKKNGFVLGPVVYVSKS